MRKLIFLSVFFINLSNLFAVEKDEFMVKPTSKNAISLADLTRNSCYGVHLGTTGIGINYKVALPNRFFARAGFSILPTSYKMPLNVSGLATTANLGLNFSNIHLLGEYQVFERIGLRLVGGLSYFTTGTLKATLIPKSSYTVENVTYTPAEIGQLELNINWKGLAPYMGLGFGMPIPESKFNVNMDLGLFYLSQPSTTVTGTARLQDNGAMATQINKNTADYRYYPVFQLSFNYKLK